MGETHIMAEDTLEQPGSGHETEAGQESQDTQTGEETNDTQAAEAVDYEQKFRAQQKVNRDLERKLKQALAKADEVEQLRAELAKLQGKEEEYAEQQKQREIEAAALAKANERVLKAEVRAAAAGKLADPADALVYIDLSEFEVDSDGNVDAEQIAKSIDDLLQRKPYLAAAQGARRFQGTADGGARKGSTQPSQLSRDDLKGMSHHEIVQAKAEGRLKNLLEGE